MREGYERALVLAAQDGDPRAVDRLVAEYLPLVYNVVGRALDGHADVDDVVQETMLRCVTGLYGTGSRTPTGRARRAISAIRAATTSPTRARTSPT
jgi:DNA-directed RNA polymerase specialized sigma24 family protein